LHYALQKSLGKDAHQMGSKVEDDWLRFDFGNPSPVSAEQLAQIERDSAERIGAAEKIEWKYVPIAEARAAGAMMLFGEKYPDPARMVSMGTFSRELCGGTHLDNTRDVGALEITAEEGVAAGTRRITALTGAKAREHLQHTESALGEIAGKLRWPCRCSGRGRSSRARPRPARPFQRRQSARRTPTARLDSARCAQPKPRSATWLAVSECALFDAARVAALLPKSGPEASLPDALGRRFPPMLLAPSKSAARRLLSPRPLQPMPT
jgi:alanyl-tRNA synthetase